MSDLNSKPQEYEAVRQRMQKPKRQLWIVKIFNGYCSHCSIHGLQYLSEEGLSNLEKVFWVSVFFVSVGLCGALINNVWIKWNTSPVIVSFNERFIPVGKVPFPSVTICPQTKNKVSVFNFTEYLEYTSLVNEMRNKRKYKAEEMAKIVKGEDISLVCLKDFNDDSNTITNRTYTNSSLVNNLIEVAPNVSDSMMQCLWKDKEVDCEEFFKNVLTKEGLCFNFNALAAEEIFNKNNLQNDYPYLETTRKSKNWNLLDGYTKYDREAYPRRASENGAKPDLSIILQDFAFYRDGMCNGINRGYKIYVQHPADVPQASLYYYAALPQQVSSLALKFNMISTSENLINYDPDVRQCYFPHERPLRFFNKYTASNCLLECLSNYTYQKCGCVSFYMPHHDSQHICTIQSTDCVNDAQDELSANDGEHHAGACKCYPDCHSITYDAEILKTDFNLNSFSQNFMRLHKEQFQDDEIFSLSKSDFSKIEFYFKQPRFISMQRSELFGATDFLANCGGLLGLFLGFSFLSLIEIVYFLTLRFFCDVKREAKKENKNVELSENTKLNEND